MKAMEKGEDIRRRPGRPLSFQREEALQKAMVQFWRTGYETTSIADLTTAMGITPPSLYAAFGDKQQLFLEAVQHYLAAGADTAKQAHAAVTARETAAILLRQSALLFTQPDMPLGCLVASSGATGSSAATEVRGVLTGIRDTTRQMLQTRAEQDIAAGRLPADTDSAALAGLTIAILQGMSVLARDGASREDLLALAAQAERAWPN